MSAGECIFVVVAAAVVAAAVASAEKTSVVEYADAVHEVLVLTHEAVVDLAAHLATADGR